MKILKIVLLSLFVITGCDRISTKSPVEFQLRDASIDENGMLLRATLITTNDSIRKGTYVVWLASRNPGLDAKDIQQVVLEEGVGSVSLIVAGVSKPSEIEWKILGYTELSAGKVSLK